MRVKLNRQISCTYYFYILVVDCLQQITYLFCETVKKLILIIYYQLRKYVNRCLKSCLCEKYCRIVNIK
jgi:hypothetical protein